MARQKRDFVGNIMAWEAGEMNAKEEYSFFKKNRGQLINLQGMYGRRLAELGLLDNATRRKGNAWLRQPRIPKW